MNKIKDFTYNLTENKNVDLLCWWCCHSFKNKPYFLPYTYDELNDKYKVIGWFCSIPCSVAYNINFNDGNSNISNRLSLIKTMYNIKGRVNPASPREVLDKFGGPFSIEEYRKNNEENLIYSPVFPPIVPLNISIEQSSYIDVNSIIRMPKKTKNEEDEEKSLSSKSSRRKKKKKKFVEKSISDFF